MFRLVKCHFTRHFTEVFRLVSMPPKRKAASTQAGTKKMEPVQVEEVSESKNGPSPPKRKRVLRERKDAVISDPIPSTSGTLIAKSAAGRKKNNDETKKENKVKKEKQKKEVKPKKEKTKEVKPKKENQEKNEEETKQKIKEVKAKKESKQLKTKKQNGNKEEDEPEEINPKNEAKTTKIKKEKPKKEKKTKESGDALEKKENNEKPLLNPTITNWKEINFTCSRKSSQDISYNLIISSWNVGGVKSWLKKHCMEYLEHEKPDIFCLQEIKSSEDKLPKELKEIKGYHQYWCSSAKEGYAGVGLLSVKKPLNVTYGINDEEQDVEGRCITAEYENFYLVNVYVPNAGRKLVTLPKRLAWNQAFKDYIASLDEKKPLVICGDMNVAHNEVDLARPKTNTKNAGFTVEEREGMTEFLKEGFVDIYRRLYPDKKDVYSFWTYMANARANNVGWRLDYFLTSERLTKSVCDAVYRTDILGSDHCPVTLFINI